MSKPKKCENKGKCHKAFKKAADGTTPVTPDAENDNKCCPKEPKKESKCCPSKKPKDGGGCG